MIQLNKKEAEQFTEIFKSMIAKDRLPDDCGGPANLLTLGTGN